jgi:acyl-[acyl carrier protein]--UDP-N-acetylglucosamine O-acyltransferase
MTRAIGYRTLAAIAAVLTLMGCDISVDGNGSGNSKVNGSVHIAAGQAAEDASTVNGSVHIDDNATVGSATTVNGSVRLGAHATATSMKTVNGAISLGDGAHVSGKASSVNGDLTLGNNSEVAGSLTNVNGKISLSSAHVAGGIRTVNGNISIMGTSRVEGGILVEKPNSLMFNSEDPVIVIGPGAVVQGEMKFERKVKLYVSDKATIGTVTGATPIPYSGETPPN